ncbi:P-loop containing nucleoside triphosphate hydrolase protein, partial [Crucibulum laeve]
NKRLLVGICGIPASGKSTFAKNLVEYTNKHLAESSAAVHDENSALAQAILVGLDGWHLTRAQLDLFPDAKLAHDRRGIHWTFDGPGYVDFVRSLRAADTPVITAPSFDHALKDPTPHAVTIYPYHRIVIIEGLYTFLSLAPWKEGGILLDERWFIQVDIDEAQQRLVKRHVVSGVARDHDEAVWRAEQNDMPNGRFIMANMLEATRVIVSNDDPALALS